MKVSANKDVFSVFLNTLTYIASANEYFIACSTNMSQETPSTGGRCIVLEAGNIPKAKKETSTFHIHS